MTVVQLPVRFTLCLCMWLFITGKALGKEDGGRYKITCEKGMPSYAAVSPYPYPVVDIDENNVKGQFLCDASTDLGGWILVQRRVDGKVSFDRKWRDYKNGFGALDTDYWMGLETMHRLTSNGGYELRVDLKKKGAEPAFAHYSWFAISSEGDNYRLDLGYYINGTATDAFTPHNGKEFSTSDRDNDSKRGPGNKRSKGKGRQGGGNRRGKGGDDKNNCAATNHGGWWFTDCDSAYLNGLWGATKDEAGSVEWNYYSTSYLQVWDTVELTEMKIRRTK